MTTTTTRKAATRKKTTANNRKAEAEAAHLASLSPWVRELHALAKPLTGKLTKAIAQK
jgi:hypothetical protein